MLSRSEIRHWQPRLSKRRILSKHSDLQWYTQSIESLSRLSSHLGWVRSRRIWTSGRNVSSRKNSRQMKVHTWLQKKWEPLKRFLTQISLKICHNHGFRLGIVIFAEPYHCHTDKDKHDADHVSEVELLLIKEVEQDWGKNDPWSEQGCDHSLVYLCHRSILKRDQSQADQQHVVQTPDANSKEGWPVKLSRPLRTNKLITCLSLIRN